MQHAQTLARLELFEVAQWLHKYEQYRQGWKGVRLHRTYSEIPLLIGALWFVSPAHHALSKATFGILHHATLEEFLDLVVEPEYHQDIKNALYANGHQDPVFRST